MCEEIRKRLALFKKETKLTNRQLAILCKTTRQRVSRWLDGTSKIPTELKIYLDWLSEGKECK